EQRIIGASWGFGDGATGGVRELVGAADDEAFEGVLLVQQGVRVPVAHVRVRGCGRRRLGRRECLVVGFWLLGALMLLGQALGGGSGLGMCWAHRCCRGRLWIGRCWREGRGAGGGCLPFGCALHGGGVGWLGCAL